MAFKTLYELLNLSQTASHEAIRTVIRQRRSNLDRDSTAGDRGAQLETLAKAEATLLNPQARAKYDLDHYGSTSVTVEAAAPISSSPPSLPPQLPAAPVTTSKPPVLPATSQSTGLPPVPFGAGKCPTCSTPIQQGSPHCPVCGTEYASIAPINSVMASTDTRTFSGLLGNGPTQTPEKLKQVFQAIGWSHARGTIVTADQPYHVEEEFNLPWLLLKIGLILLAVYIAYHVLLAELGLFIFIAIIVLFIAVVFGAGLAMMIIRPIIGLLTMFIPKGRGGGKDKKQVMVREVRLRDEAMHEYNVRFRGELRSGHINVGDTIEIWGRNRGGTIMARWGYNFRTRSQIWVHYR